MKGFGTDEKALIGVIASPKYANPWIMQQLAADYNHRFMRDLAKDIESETSGDLEEALITLIRSPLEQDVRVLNKALDRAGTDEDAVNDVLLNRSNADLRVIVPEYKKIVGRDLLKDIQDDVNEPMGRVYSMVLSAQRAEDSAPVIPQEIEKHVAELQRATEGTSGGNAISVAQIFTSSNDAQIKAMAHLYHQKYHKHLTEAVEKAFRGDMEDVLMRMLVHGVNPALSDAEQLGIPLNKSPRKDSLFINRLVRLHRDRPRLERLKEPYKKKWGKTLGADIREELKGDYERCMLAIIGEK